MRKIVSILLVGATASFSAAIPALAGQYSTEPVVIPGVGGPGYAVDRPRTAGPSPYGGGYAAVPRRPNYGGGLIEFMMSGSEPTQPASYPAVSPVARPQPARMAYNADAIRPSRAIDPIYQRQEVDFAGAHPPGTIVVDTSNKFLYLVEAPGRALRYGIGVGRPGFLWTGSKTITRKAEWPDWTPPAEMMLRRPDLPSHMEGGLANPLGARAMYLGSSLFRIHGTNEPDTIGTNVSSGCIRLTNEDVTDLYGRVRVGTHVIVM